jgi:3-keto-disaccharide hydrolase
MKGLLWALLCLVVTCPAGAQAPPGRGWISLFNGKDLTGWVKNGQEKWTVENGAILGESTVGHYGYLTTKRTYRNFDLRLKFKPETDGNSGVFTRSRITGNSPKTGPDIEGEQIEVDPTRNTGSIYESGGRGWIAMGTPACERAIKPRSWNDLEIREDGFHYVTRLNGVPCVNFTDAAAEAKADSQLHEASQTNGVPKSASGNHSLAVTSGVMGLQLHTGGGVKILFKNIYVKEIGKP